MSKTREHHHRVVEFYKDFKYNLIHEGATRKRIFCLKCLKRLSLWTLKLSLLAFLIVFIVGPFIYKYLYSVQRSLVFLNFVSWPRNPNFSNPSEYGVEGALNFYITNDDGDNRNDTSSSSSSVKLGVWQLLPEDLIDDITNRTQQLTKEEYFRRALRNGRNVIIYNHGNSGHRIAPHRVELYKILRRHFHVICWDYRGYGDSADIEPTEHGLVSDATFIYKWVLNHTDAKIFIWGHSLGTGVSTHMLGDMARAHLRKPSGLFLESPFTSFTDEIAEHPFAKIFRPLPWFHYTIIDPMLKNGFVFASDRHIIKVDCPIIILHAEDDMVVPYKLGEKLYKIASEFRRNDIQGNLTFLGFDKKLGYGHKFICRATDMDDIITNFVNRSIKEVEEKKLY